MKKYFEESVRQKKLKDARESKEKGNDIERWFNSIDLINFQIQILPDNCTEEDHLNAASEISSNIYKEIKSKPRIQSMAAEWQ